MNERIILPTREGLEADSSDDAKKRQTFERGSDGRLPKITANEISEIEKMIYAYLDNGAKFEDIQPIVNDKLKELGVGLDLVKDGGVAIVFVDTDGREVERVIVVDSRDFGTTILNSEIAEIPKLAELSEQSLLPDLSDKSFTPNVTDSTETPLPSLSPDWPTAKQETQVAVQLPDLFASPEPETETEEQPASTAEEVQKPDNANKDKIQAEIKSLVNNLWMGLGEDARKYIELQHQVEDVISHANLALRSIPNADTQRLFGEIKKTFNLFEYQINSQQTQQRRSDVGKLKGFTINGQQGEVVSGIKGLDYQLTAYLESGQRDTSQIYSTLELMIRNINNSGLDEDGIRAIRNQLSPFMDLIASRRQQIFTLQDGLASVLSSL